MTIAQVQSNLPKTNASDEQVTNLLSSIGVQSKHSDQTRSNGDEAGTNPNPYTVYSGLCSEKTHRNIAEHHTKHIRQ